MVQAHPSVSEHCETTTNQSQDSCLEHFWPISLPDFEFRQKFQLSISSFFLRRGMRLCRRDYLRNKQIYVQLFLFGRQVIF